ncbi:MAG: NifB/NifX family molybdenum-iron cluster-binding protein [Peptococcaceae bacterium]|nr:NifB/NifX family molybdenum-iron cluster-binding protein [Peptococcaceae bacterium]
MKHKIIVASENGMVAGHFGHCPEFTVVEINDDGSKNINIIPNPGHQPGFLPRYFAQLGATHIIAGGMGPKAQELFAQNGIQTIIGAQGPIEEVVQSYLDGSLKTGVSLCHHGSEGHSCGSGNCHE